MPFIPIFIHLLTLFNFMIYIVAEYYPYYIIIASLIEALLVLQYCLYYSSKLINAITLIEIAACTMSLYTIIKEVSNYNKFSVYVACGISFVNIFVALAMCVEDCRKKYSPPQLNPFINM